jgi:hypothetical protein
MAEIELLLLFQSYRNNKKNCTVVLNRRKESTAVNSDRSHRGSQIGEGAQKQCANASTGYSSSDNVERLPG